MGYEVLDSRPPRGEPDPPDVRWSGPSAVPPRDVVTIDPDDDPGEDLDGPDPRSRAPLRRFSARVVTLVVAAAHGPHRVVLLSGATLAVGALAGGVVGGAVGSAMAQRAAERTSLLDQSRTVAVVAYADDVVRYLGAGGRTALLDVRVANAGPRPVEVVVTSPWIEARPGRPVVRQNSPSPVVHPGSSIDVMMTVLTPCGDPAAGIPTVPVRTLDGTVHAVPIRSGGGALDLSPDCAR